MSKPEPTTVQPVVFDEEGVDLVALDLEADLQPTRKGTAKPPRRFDRTYLHEDVHGQRVHRDYAAHYFRWGFIHREMKKTDRILEVGCGPELPLVQIISGYQPIIPDHYCGVDMNRLPFQPKRSWATYWELTDFTTRWPEVANIEGKFTKAVCLEVIEHMAPNDGMRLLHGISSMLHPGGLLYLSTPVFDGYRAANHIHEWTIPELTLAIQDEGFLINHRWGTFANLPELEKVLDPNEAMVYGRLKAYYGGEVLSCMFAPYHPDSCRNNLWVCRKEES